MRHYGANCQGWDGWLPVDQLSFGPRREPRRLPRRLRAFGTAVVIAGAAAAGVAVAVTAASAQHAVTSPPPASQAAGLPAPIGLPAPGCSPADATWPNLTDLPVQMRTRARSIIIDGQFSGRCPAR
jgi:hypothetical protein